MPVGCSPGPAIDDAETLLKANIGLLNHALNRWFSRHLRRWGCELRSIGMEALWRAVVRFDPTRGVRFSTFATVTICRAMRNELNRLVRASLPTVRLPDDDGIGLATSDEDGREAAEHREMLALHWHRLTDRQRDAMELWLTGLTFREIAARLGVSPSRAQQLHHMAVARLREVCR